MSEVQIENITKESETVDVEDGVSKSQEPGDEKIDLHVKSSSKSCEKLLSSVRVHLIILNLHESTVESAVLRLEKGWAIQFSLGPSLISTLVRLFVNHPLNEKVWNYDKENYEELAWPKSSALDVGDCLAQLQVSRAGSFHYYYTLDGTDCKKNACGSGYFLVDPEVRVGPSAEKIPLNGIVCQTVLSKSLGPFCEWPDRLRVAWETGYNAIHFTPIQQLGCSAYALVDQLKANPVFSTKDKHCDMSTIEDYLKHINENFNMLSFTDIVLNHTAVESSWIQDRPECVYNLVNSPHLRPAYLLDRALLRFSDEVADGKWFDFGVPASLKSEDQLVLLRIILQEQVLPKLKLFEFYLIPVDETLSKFRNALQCDIPENLVGSNAELTIISDPEFRRLKSSVDIQLAIKKLFCNQSSDISKEEKIANAEKAFCSELEKLNARMTSLVDDHISTAIRNFVDNVRYRFLDPSGPKFASVSRTEPLMHRYFLSPYENLSLENDESDAYCGRGAWCMAHNGWLVKNDDPFFNFAEPGSFVYLRREVVQWTDSVKLRYGRGYDDCPFLWDHMKRYVEETARLFHGVRLDNCHNTPIHVTDWMLTKARAVRPDLYVMAELFTCSQNFDNIFINRLGLNALIGEALMVFNQRELIDRVRRYSGSPLGMIMQSSVRPLANSVAHDIFYDQTHDNQSVVEKQNAFHILPNAAMVAFCGCAVGSNRGYDEIVPKYISVMDEKRLYRSWTDKLDSTGNDMITSKTGIISAKKLLNQLHLQLTIKGYSEIGVEELSDDITMVTRHNPASHNCIVLVARNSFKSFVEAYNLNELSKELWGSVEKVVLEAHMVCIEQSEFVQDPNFINGLDNYQLVLNEDIDVEKSRMIKLSSVETGQGRKAQLMSFLDFPPGAIVVLRVKLDDIATDAVKHCRSLLSSFGHSLPGFDLVESIDTSELQDILRDLTLVDLNHVLFRCSPEERGVIEHSGIYHVPGFGDLPYCGIVGVVSIFSKIRSTRNMDHPLCRNIRDGNWLMEYCTRRLVAVEGTKRLGTWLKVELDRLKLLPSFLVPLYFDAIITSLYVVIEEIVWSKLSDFIANGSSFVRALGLATLQFCGEFAGSPLPDLSPALEMPKPRVVADHNGKVQQICTTIAAGLPHFSSGTFRNWGRDTFISIRGLLLVTGRFDEARFIILAFAGCLRYGLIPNLLGSATHEPMYSCRDAVWWWLQAVQDFCKMAPLGIGLLQDKARHFTSPSSFCSTNSLSLLDFKKMFHDYPTDESLKVEAGEFDQALYDVIQEALQRHAVGLKCQIEVPMGPGVSDENLSKRIEIGVDWETGFVFGGNEHNCGTWMDMTGSSVAAGNHGKPATPRDGSAVELVGLCYSAVNWLSSLHKDGLYPYSGVKRQEDGCEVETSFVDWARLIATSFEKKFWIDPEMKDDPHPELVNRCGIYRDTWNASQTWTNYQLRPNSSITIAIAPDLVDPDHAWHALEQAGEVLMGPLGIKTLDPTDWSYRGNYNVGDNSKDYAIAGGFNYHQGPEWVWVVGYFIRAMFQVAMKLELNHPGILLDTIANAKRILSSHHAYLLSSDWRSLPELTNANGQFCPSSCVAQAWSIGCILDAVYDMSHILEESTQQSSSD